MKSAYNCDDRGPVRTNIHYMYAVRNQSREIADGSNSDYVILLTVQ